MDWDITDEERETMYLAERIIRDPFLTTSDVRDRVTMGYTQLQSAVIILDTLYNLMDYEGRFEDGAEWMRMWVVLRARLTGTPLSPHPTGLQHPSMGEPRDRKEE